MRKEKENSSDNPYQYSLKQNLEDAGCSDEMVQQFMELRDKGEEEKQLLLLSGHRKIDCLDYLVYRLQKRQ